MVIEAGPRQAFSSLMQPLKDLPTTLLSFTYDPDYLPPCRAVQRPEILLKSSGLAMFATSFTVAAQRLSLYLILYYQKIDNIIAYIKIM